MKVVLSDDTRESRMIHVMINITDINTTVYNMYATSEKLNDIPGYIYK